MWKWVKLVTTLSLSFITLDELRVHINYSVINVEKDFLIFLIHNDFGAKFNSNEGPARGGGSGDERGGADRDSKWRPSIDLCTKCHFIWGLVRDGWTSNGGKRPWSSILILLSIRIHVSTHYLATELKVTLWWRLSDFRNTYTSNSFT